MCAAMPLDMALSVQSLLYRGFNFLILDYFQFLSFTTEWWMCLCTVVTDQVYGTTGIENDLVLSASSHSHLYLFSPCARSFGSRTLA